MEKYIKSVLYDSDIRLAKDFYIRTCMQDCKRLDSHFQYGEKFVANCEGICTRKHEEFMDVYNKEEGKLREGVQDCLDQYEQQELKQCVLRYQYSALQKFAAAITKLKFTKD